MVSRDPEGAFTYERPPPGRGLSDFACAIFLTPRPTAHYVCATAYLTNARHTFRRPCGAAPARADPDRGRGSPMTRMSREFTLVLLGAGVLTAGYFLWPEDDPARKANEQANQGRVPAG